MLVVASLKRSLKFDPVEQGVKRKRTQLKLTSTSSNTYSLNNSLSPSKSTNTSISSSSPTRKPIASTLASTDDVPMFTNLQTAQMCARLLREQDQSIREQYEQLLTSKLAEQYDQFVRYSHDSIHKHQSKPVHFCFDPSQDSNATTSLEFSYVS